MPIEISPVTLDQDLTLAASVGLALSPRVRIPARSLSDGGVFEIEVMAKIQNGGSGAAFRALMVPVISYVGDTTTIADPLQYGCYGHDGNDVTPSGGSTDLYLRMRSLIRIGAFTAANETSCVPQVSCETYISENSAATSTQLSGGSYAAAVNCAQELELRPYFFYRDSSTEGATIKSYFCNVTVTTPITGRAAVPVNFYD